MLLSASEHPGTAHQAASIALWSIGQQSAELVAGVQLPCRIDGLAWHTGAQPTFYVASSQGLTEWRLEPDALCSTAIHMPPALRGLALTAVACGAEHAPSRSTGSSSFSSWQPTATRTADADRTVFVGDATGRVWRLLVDAGQDAHSPLLVAALGGQPVTCLQPAGQQCAVGTADGRLVLLEEGRGGKQPRWCTAWAQQLDVAVCSLQLQGGDKTWMAATACGTLWRVGSHASPSVLVCGQQHRMADWHFASGAGWKNVPPTAAVASASGISIWHLVRCVKGLLERN